MSSSTTRYRRRMRCRKSKCYYQFTLKRAPKGDVECPICGGETRCVEAERRRELAKQDTCNCLPIPFPHKKGAVLGCEHHPKDFNDWTIEDQRQYQGMLETARSG